MWQLTIDTQVNEEKEKKQIQGKTGEKRKVKAWPFDHPEDSLQKHEETQGPVMVEKKEVKPSTEQQESHKICSFKWSCVAAIFNTENLSDFEGWSIS